jgi:hypothetical protein
VIASSLEGAHRAMACENHWLPGFNFNVEEWIEGDRYETLAICRSLHLARAAASGGRPVSGHR